MDRGSISTSRRHNYDHMSLEVTSSQHDESIHTDKTSHSTLNSILQWGVGGAVGRGIRGLRKVSGYNHLYIGSIWRLEKCKPSS